MVFRPKFTISAAVANALMRIEAARRVVDERPMTARVQARLRETARLRASHHSTQIEGNRLTLDEATRVIEKNEHFPGRERDEREIEGYYRALDHLEKLAERPGPIKESSIRTLHALVMSGKRGRVKPTPYREGQNVIRDGQTGVIVYLPPEAKDVPSLMSALVAWLAVAEQEALPCPLRAAVAHYQLATIHPYFDGNGRTARLLATLILHLGGYGLKGFFSLEEYYARDLTAYYRAIAVGPSHNYYFGRAETDITPWLEYVCAGIADSFDSVERQTREVGVGGAMDGSQALRRLDARMRKALDLFHENETITAAQVGRLLGLAARTSRDLCQVWVESNFLVVIDPSRKARRYGLAAHLQFLVTPPR